MKAKRPQSSGRGSAVQQRAVSVYTSVVDLGEPFCAVAPPAALAPPEAGAVTVAPSAALVPAWVPVGLGVEAEPLCNEGITCS